MTVDCYIRAPSEDAFKAAIAALDAQTTHTDGSLLSSGRWGDIRFDLDAGFPVVTMPAVIEGSEVVTPAVLDPDCHANLRCGDAIYARLGDITGDAYALPGDAEIFGAICLEDGQILHGAPPATPQRVWF